MYELRVMFTEAHINSSKELAKIIRDNWPAAYVKLTTTSGTMEVEYKQGQQIQHNCTECDAALLLEGLKVKPNGLV